MIFRILFLSLTLFFVPSFAQAGLELGIGTSSATSGRVVPALSASVEISNWMLTGTSTGVKTNIYHLSSYTLGFGKRWNAGDFWWGDLNVGFGLGLAYSHYGYRTSPDLASNVDSDFTAGPLFQFRWMLAGPAYVGMDMLFGLRFPTGLIGLAAQDVVMLSLGVRL